MKTYSFGASPSARTVRSITGASPANDPRYRHRGRSSIEKSNIKLQKKLDKIKLMAMRRGLRKR